MKSRAIIPLILGLVVGFFAIKMSVNAIHRAQGSSVPVEMVDAVVAGQDINASVRIAADMLLVRKTPKTPLLPPDSFTGIDPLIGRVTSKFIPQGMPLTAGMLAAEGTLPGIEERIEEGYRAVAVQIDESTGVAYLLRPGCFVDVIVVMDVQKPDRKKETISRVLLQRVRVGAVGQMLNQSSEESANARVRSVTLIVPEMDVPKLHLAQTKGRLTLAMRSEHDVLITDKAEAQQAELFGEKTPESPDSFVGPPSPPPVIAAAEESLEPDCENSPSLLTVINGSDVFRLLYKGPCSRDLLEVHRGLTHGDSGATFSPAAYGKGQADGRRGGLSENQRRLRRLGAAGSQADRTGDDDVYIEPSYEEVGE